MNAVRLEDFAQEKGIWHHVGGSGIPVEIAKLLRPAIQGEHACIGTRVFDRVLKLMGSA